MSLNNKTHLCYIKIEHLWQWIEANNLLAQDFTREQEKWAKEINQKPNFFSDTELLLTYQDTLLLKVLTDSQANFFSKTYQLTDQTICQKLFLSPKNIILLSERQWKTNKHVFAEKLTEQKNTEKAIVLFKDRESSEKSLENWWRTFSTQS